MNYNTGSITTTEEYNSHGDTPGKIKEIYSKSTNNLLMTGVSIRKPLSYRTCTCMLYRPVLEVDKSPKLGSQVIMEHEMRCVLRTYLCTRARSCLHPASTVALTQPKLMSSQRLPMPCTTDARQRFSWAANAQYKLYSSSKY